MNLLGEWPRIGLRQLGVLTLARFVGRVQRLTWAYTFTEGITKLGTTSVHSPWFLNRATIDPDQTQHATVEVDWLKTPVKEHANDVFVLP